MYYYSVAEENNEVFDISTSTATQTHLPLVTACRDWNINHYMYYIFLTVQYTSLRVLLPSSTTVLPSISLTILLPNDGGDLIPATTTEMRSTMEVTITNEDIQPTSTTLDPSRATTYTNLQPSPFTSNEIYILPPPLTSLYSTLSLPPPPTPSASDCANGHR